MLWGRKPRRGVHDAPHPPALSPRVPPGSRPPGAGVREAGLADRQRPGGLVRVAAPLDQTSGSRRRPPQRWPDDRRARGTAPPAPRESCLARGAGDPPKSRGLLRPGDRPEAPAVFGFVGQEKAVHDIATMCRVLGVSPSGYYAWRTRPLSARAQADHVLLTRIRAIHVQSRGTYGAPRIHAELQDLGMRCARKRVARLMRQAGLSGAHRRRRLRTTIRDLDAAPAPDLVARAFATDRPNRLWIADITYVRTWSGWLYWQSCWIRSAGA